MKKIRRVRAMNMVVEAQQHVVQFQGYRLGQALFNMLPKELASFHLDVRGNVVWDDKDHDKWYQSYDTEWVIKHFYEEYVDAE